MALIVSNMLFALFVASCAGASLSFAQTSQAPVPQSTTQKQINEDLRRELLRMINVEQQARQRWIAAPAAERERIYKIEVEPLDWKSTARLREIVEKYGWPGMNLVGHDGAQAAFTLLLHSPDPEFRKKCLALTKEAVERSEVPKFAVAMLKDKVLVGDGKPQVYGTQVKVEDGKLAVLPIEDEAHVDERRAAVGLEPMAEYLKGLAEVYRPMLKQP